MHILGQINILLLLALLLTTGCSQQDGRSALYIKAQRKMQSGDYKESEKLLNAYLKLNSSSARAHKDLATLYDDRLGMPLMALYHYQKYLELAPDAADVKTVKKWMEASEHKYYLKLKDGFNDPEDMKSLKYRLEASRDQLQKVKTLLLKSEENSHKQTEQYKELLAIANANTDTLKAEMQKMQTKQWEDSYLINQLKNQLADLKKSEGNLIQDMNQLKLEGQEQTKLIASLRKELQLRPPAPPPATTPVALTTAKDDSILIPKSGDTEKSKDIPKAETKAIASDNETKKPEMASVFDAPSTEVSGSKESNKNDESTFYKIQSGDNLSKISKRFYGSGKYYQRIIDANQSLGDSPTNLKPGMVIEIPAADKKN